MAGLYRRRFIPTAAQRSRSSLSLFAATLANEVWIR